MEYNKDVAAMTKALETVLLARIHKRYVKWAATFGIDHSAELAAAYRNGYLQGTVDQESAHVAGHGR